MEQYILWFRRLLPSPFSIAFILTGVSFLAILAYNYSQFDSIELTQTVGWWVKGLWMPSLMVFAVQMMLMLILGHVLALTTTANHVIKSITNLCTSSANAAFIVSLATLLVGLFNWGLGLIFGAILARKVADHFQSRGIPLNYPLIAAAGYSALMIWHGGLSGSALIKAAEPNAISQMMAGVLPDQTLMTLPSSIPMSMTAFSSGNIFISICVLILIPSTLMFLGKKLPGSILSLAPENIANDKSATDRDAIGAEKIDRSKWTGRIVGGLILSIVIHKFIIQLEHFFTPNNINLLILGLCLLLHQRVKNFLTSVDFAMRDASGILIQFPLYFGIMGLISEGGLIGLISDAFVNISDSFSYPLYTFLSAGLVNIFVPSGGGQWVIQGPIIIEAAFKLGVPLEKGILALAYGDQITNMLQPFWALPLLGITKLSARDILPYTLAMFIVGFTIYFCGLMII